MRTSAEDSRVSDIWDSRKMMSSEQTETEVLGRLPRKQHLSNQLPHIHNFASSLSVKWEKSCFSTEQRAVLLAHLVTV